jgi:hypothetical protein
MLNEIKTAITAFVRNISQADPQKVFANKIKRVQARIDARGHQFQKHFVSTQRLSKRTVLVTEHMSFFFFFFDRCTEQFSGQVKDVQQMLKDVVNSFLLFGHTK